MVKRLALTTRAFGAESGVPDILTLASWVAEHRGMTADILTCALDQSLSPQLSAGITMPCAGGMFYRDRILSCLIGVNDKKAVDEIGIRADAVIEDASALVAEKKGVWCAMPAPHALGITDTYYNDEEEWNDALAGAYHTLMRAMRDAGVAGHVLIGDIKDDTEITRLARQNVFFFMPEQDRESLEYVLEHQKQIAVSKAVLNTVFELRNEYELRRIIVMDPNEDAISLALSHMDPDQVIAGGYCTEKCDTYWKSVLDTAYYVK